MPAPLPQPLLIRADAGPGMGAGHVMRCLALAQAWRRLGGQPVFLGVMGEGLARRLQAEGCRLLPARPDARGGVAEILAACTPGQWVVLDGYGFAQDWQAALRSAGRRVLVVDDQHHLAEYQPHVLLNQNIRADDIAYNLPQDALLLAGTRYALIREEFAVRPRSPREPAAPRRIFVTLGGADVFGITPLVLRGLALVGQGGLDVRVAVGPEDPRLAEIRALGRTLAYAVEALPAPDMAEQMAWADLAVTAAGVTCWELACMGVPMAVLTVADNQGENAAGLSAAGAAVDLGQAGLATEAGLAEALGGLLADPARLVAMSAAGRGLVDGRGAHRAAEVMAALASERLDVAGMLRPAEPGDCRSVWRLSNHPQVRANSFSQEAIPYGDHCRWFEKLLADPDRMLYIADVGGLVAGQVRYDRHGCAAELSFSVHPAFQGKGLGSGLLRRTLALACSRLGVAQARGLVLPGNEGSRRCFERAGFTSAGLEERDGRLCLRFTCHCGATCRRIKDEL